MGQKTSASREVVPCRNDNDKIWKVAQALSEILPEGDKEKKF